MEQREKEEGSKERLEAEREEEKEEIRACQAASLTLRKPHSSLREAAGRFPEVELYDQIYIAQRWGGGCLVIQKTH